MKMNTQLIKSRMKLTQCLEKKMIALNTYIRKGKRYQISDLSYHLKKLEKVSRKANNKDESRIETNETENKNYR